MAKKGQEVQALANGITDVPTQRAIRALERSITDKTESLQGGITSIETTVIEVAGTAGVTSVSAANSMVTCSPTTGAVVVGVVPGNFTGIPESGVTNLVSDLASKLPAANISGTSGRVSRFTGTNSLGNASILDDGNIATIAGLCGTKQAYTTPTGIQTVALSSTTTLIEFNCSAQLDLVGISGGTADRFVWLHNKGSANVVVYVENGNASAVDRFKSDPSSSGGILVNTCGLALAKYDGTAQRWIIFWFLGVNTPAGIIVNGDLNITGSISSVQNITATGTITALKAVVSGLSGNDSLTANFTSTGQITDLSSIVASNSGTYDATAAVRKAYGVNSSVTATRSAGANNLTNIAGRFNASGGQVNRALQTDAGDVVLNDTSGITTIKGATTVQNTFSVTGGATIGDAAGDAHALTGSLALQGAAGSDGQLIVRSGGLPTWATISSISGVTGTGSADYVARWLNSVSITTGVLRDDGTTAFINDAQFKVDTSNTTVSAVKAIAVAGSTHAGRTMVEALVSGDFTSATVIAVEGAAFGKGTGGSGVTNFGVKASATGAVATVGTTVNIALQANAVSGDTNIALKTIDGDVILNDNSGTTSIKGNTTIGDASTDTHTLHGNLTIGDCPAAGAIKYNSVNARISLGRQVFTSGGTYTPTTGTKAVRVRMVGAGGGGGGASATSGHVSCGGGGGSGVYWEKWIDAAANITGGTVTIGSGGSAGTSGGGNGGNGGDTSVVIQATTYTAKGGLGGTGGTQSGGLALVSGGYPQSGSTSGYDRIAGDNGQPGIIVADSGVGRFGGSGGSNPFGIGGNGPANVALQGKGAGGRGAQATSANVAGEAGADGYVIIEEYA